MHAARAQQAGKRHGWAEVRGRVAWKAAVLEHAADEVLVPDPGACVEVVVHVIDARGGSRIFRESLEFHGLLDSFYLSLFYRLADLRRMLRWYVALLPPPP